MTDEKPTRNHLRTATLSATPKFRSEMVEVNGAQFEVRQPSVQQRALILRAGNVQSGETDKADISRLQVCAVIRCTYVPGTNEQVFELADQDSLLAMPSGGFVDKLSEVALRLMNVDAEAAAKKSEATPNDSSSFA